MAKGNGKNGRNDDRAPAWWGKAKDELKQELLAALEPRFQSIETKLVVIDMKVDALDTRVTRVESTVDELGTKIDVLDARVTRVEKKVDALDTKVEVIDVRVTLLESQP